MTNRRNFLKGVGALGATTIVGIPTAATAAVEVAGAASASGLAAAAAAVALPWNWKDLVAFQPSLAKTGNVHCLMVREPEEDQPPSQIKIQICSKIEHFSAQKMSKFKSKNATFMLQKNNKKWRFCNIWT